MMRQVFALVAVSVVLGTVGPAMAQEPQDATVTQTGSERAQLFDIARSPIGSPEPGFVAQTDESVVDIDLATPPGGEEGLYVTHNDGWVEAHGGLPHFGDRPVLLDGETVIALSVRPAVDGYWLFTSLGRAFPYGAAEWFGDAGNLALAAPMISAIAMPDGAGYYMVAEDGGIFTYGSAVFFGSVPQVLPGVALDGPVIGILPSTTGLGYQLVASDGGLFAFGDAEFHGSIPGVLPGVTLDSPVVGAIPQPDGYHMVAGDGGMFSFGTAAFHGSLGGTGSTGIVAAAVKPDNSGYVMVDGLGKRSAFGDKTGLEPVYLPVGADLQSIVDAHPAGTTFMIGAGVHRMQSIVPRDGDTFIAEPGAELNGSQELHGWTRRTGTFPYVGKSWRHTLAEPFERGLLNGECEDEDDDNRQDKETGVHASIRQELPCIFAEQLYVTSPISTEPIVFERVSFDEDKTLQPGEWMVEHSDQVGPNARPLVEAVYVGQDLSGFTVELSTAPFAFGYDFQVPEGRQDEFEDEGGIAYSPDYVKYTCLPDTCPGNFEVVYPSNKDGVAHTYRSNNEDDYP
ncbi:MAG: hypothetical protein GY708_11370, partial [Actinomycetia bacterium]|nr:hypothetical protein [Actinomycetes bacterium]